MGELRTLHKKEKNARAVDRLLACMARKDGGSVQAIGKNPDRANTTTYDGLQGGGPDRPYGI